MKKSVFKNNLRKILFVIGCVILAFAFWFVVEYNELGNVASGLNIC
jgi:hypothetical protein